MNLKEDFLDYFNRVLRNVLNYPETYIFFIDGDKITLLPSSKPKLIEIIERNPDVGEIILAQITEGVQNKDSGVQSIKFSSHGNAIVIQLNRIKQIINLDIGIFANIASNLNEKSLGNFCIAFENLCIQPVFW